MFDFNYLGTNNSSYLRLAILPSVQSKAWEQAQNHSHAIARYNAYINYISLHTCINWLLEDDVQNISIFPSENSLPSLWEVVNGAAINIDTTRIVLIPCESSELEELSVPQEWIDISIWTADYYLAVIVNLEMEEDESYLEICGFTTHRYLKNFGEYNESDRTYILPVEHLNQDITVMQKTLGLRMQEIVPQLPTLSTLEAKKLLEILGNSSIYSPRLQVNDMTFEEWASLLINEEWRQQLYEQRMGKVVSSSAPVHVADLKKWLQNLVEDIWQTYEAIYTSLELVPVRGQTEIESMSANDIPNVINLLLPHQPEQVRLHAAAVLGEIGVGNSHAINALTQLIHTAKDEETRWQAALSLGKIDPKNPLAGIQRAKLIDLGFQLSKYPLILIVAIMRKNNDRIGVWLKVESLKESYLPANLKLSVLSESGEPIPGLEVTARNSQSNHGDKLIAKRFNPPPGTRFYVKIALNDLSVIQDFLV